MTNLAQGALASVKQNDEQPEIQPAYKDFRQFEAEWQERVKAGVPVAWRMKQRRLELGIKAKAVADMAGLNYSAYTNYENGIREAKPTIIHCISEILQCSPAYLAGWQEDMGVEGFIHPVGPKQCSVQFTEDYLKSRAINMQAVEEFELQDDTMAPLLERGDIVVADTNQTLIDSRQLFLLEVHGRKIVRWLVPNNGPEGGFIISTSKNERLVDDIYVKQIAVKKYRIVGRIAGFYRGIF